MVEDNHHCVMQVTEMTVVPSGIFTANFTDEREQYIVVASISSQGPHSWQGPPSILDARDETLFVRTLWLKITIKVAHNHHKTNARSV